VKAGDPRMPWQHIYHSTARRCGFSAFATAGAIIPAIRCSLRARNSRRAATVRQRAAPHQCHRVSANGCYVESMQPLPLGTVLQVDLWLDSEHIKVTACGPHVGSWRGQWNRVHRDARDTKQTHAVPIWKPLTRKWESPRLRIQTRSSVLGTLIFD